MPDAQDEISERAGSERKRGLRKLNGAISPVLPGRQSAEVLAVWQVIGVIGIGDWLCFCQLIALTAAGRRRHIRGRLSGSKSRSSLDDSASKDQTSQHADGERSATEAKQVDAIPRVIVLAQEAVETQHIPLQTDARCTAKDGERLEVRSPDPIVVTRDLLFRIGQVERLVETPDVGLEQFARAVTCSV